MNRPFQYLSMRRLALAGVVAASSLSFVRPAEASATTAHASYSNSFQRFSSHECKERATGHNDTLPDTTLMACPTNTHKFIAWTIDRHGLYVDGTQMVFTPSGLEHATVVVPEGKINVSVTKVRGSKYMWFDLAPKVRHFDQDKMVSEAKQAISVMAHDIGSSFFTGQASTIYVDQRPTFASEEAKILTLPASKITSSAPKTSLDVLSDPQNLTVEMSLNVEAKSQFYVDLGSTFLTPEKSIHLDTLDAAQVCDKPSQLWGANCFEVHRYAYKASSPLSASSDPINNFVAHNPLKFGGVSFATALIIGYYFGKKRSPHAFPKEPNPFIKAAMKFRLSNVMGRTPAILISKGRDLRLMYAARENGVHGDQMLAGNVVDFVRGTPVEKRPLSALGKPPHSQVSSTDGPVLNLQDLEDPRAGLTQVSRTILERFSVALGSMCYEDNNPEVRNYGYDIVRRAKALRHMPVFFRRDELGL